MATAPSVSLEEYLNAEYEPDCEYINGVVEERNVGKRKHSETQALLTALLLAAADRHDCRVLTEQRVRISPSRFRIPDVCLVSRDNSDEVIQEPPVLWIEILSPEDRWSRIQQKIADVLQFGVGAIWIVDPYSRTAWIATQGSPVSEVTDGILRSTNPTLELRLEDILPRD